ncbi:MAG: rod shape-determining protein RodA [Gammaproteobacteria bacterium]|nr:rod shape-determining protein RodA [Gammaproteobacteria bacterium]
MVKDKKKYLLHHLHIDVQLLFALIVLILLGLIILYSASNESAAMIQKQGLRIFAGSAIMLMVAQIPPQRWFNWTPWIFSIGIVLLIAVLLMGTIGKGARRWLDFGLFRFQPSEMMKLAVPMMIAWLMAEANAKPTWKLVILALSTIALPVLLIAKQPDLGTSILVASSGLFVIFMAGVPWRWIIGFTVSVILFSIPLWLYLMQDYQRQRVLTMFDPESDPLGSGYHIIQSKIAIGSGGLYGKGWLNGTQSHLEFLPERHTDFIFAVFAEEFGLMGTIALLTIYLFIIVRGLYMASQAQGSFARLLSVSITLTFLVYIFVNIGMVSGILPVVGVPLPLVSYGGTSLITLMAGFGLLMSLYSHRRMLAR